MRSEGKAYIDKMKDFFPVLVLSERTKQVSDLLFIEREDGQRTDYKSAPKIPDKNLLTAILNGHSISTRP